MNNIKGALIGVGLLGIVAAFGYNSVNNVRLIEKNQLLEYLQYLDQNLQKGYHKLCEFYNETQNVIEEHKLKFQGDLLKQLHKSEKQLKHKISKELKILIQKEESLLQVKYQFTHKQIQKSIKYYKEEKEVLELVQKMINDQENILIGICPKLQISDQILNQLNPQICLQLQKKIMVSRLLLFQQVFKQIIEKDMTIEKINIQDQQVLQKISSIDFDKDKIDIIQSNIGQLTEQIDKIFNQILLKYKNENEAFRQELIFMEDQYEIQFRKLIEDPFCQLNQNLINQI